MLDSLFPTVPDPRHMLPSTQQSRLWKLCRECAAVLRRRGSRGRLLLLWLYLVSTLSGGMTLTSSKSCQCSQANREQGTCCCQPGESLKPCCAAKQTVKPCCAAKQQQAAKPCCQARQQAAEENEPARELSCLCGCKSGKFWTPGVPPHLAPAVLPPLPSTVDTLEPLTPVCYLAPVLPLEPPPPKTMIG